MQRRYLPEREYRGNTAHQKSRAAINLVVATRAGVESDYGDVAGWWRVQDLASYSLDALIIMVRIAAERTGRAVPDICRDVAAAHGADL